MLFKQFNAHDYIVKRSGTVGIDSVFILLLIAVERHADEKIILPEKFAPLIIKERTVCLYGKGNFDARSVIFFNQRDKFSVKIYPPDKRLAALKNKSHKIL